VDPNDRFLLQMQQKIDEAACKGYEAGNETAASAKRESQACYLLIDSRA
jgi:NADH:ubiquinone oxidoreductase subunit 3 (subunit A)